MKEIKKAFKCENCNSYSIYPIAVCRACGQENKITDFKQAYTDTAKAFESYIKENSKTLALQSRRYYRSKKNNKVIKNVNVALSVLCLILCYILVFKII